jgi:hypothetical protein
VEDPGAAHTAPEGSPVAPLHPCAGPAAVARVVASLVSRLEAASSVAAQGRVRGSRPRVRQLVPGSRRVRCADYRRLETVSTRPDANSRHKTR